MPFLECLNILGDEPKLEYESLSEEPPKQNIDIKSVNEIKCNFLLHDATYDNVDHVLGETYTVQLNILIKF